MLVRPLARQYKNKSLVWRADGREIRVQMWRNLVLNTIPPNPNHQTVDVYAFYDPAFKQPWLLATPVILKAQSVHAIYTDRWPVEQIPLSAKHMVGAHRQFVHNPECIQRLPELALLAGSILSFLASLAPTPTGFWDRHPKPTPGRLRRPLLAQPFPKEAPLAGQFREKHAASAHLPKGNLARQFFTAQC